LAEVDNLVLLFLLLFVLITVGKLLNPHCLINVTYYIIKNCGWLWSLCRVFRGTGWLHGCAT